MIRFLLEVGVVLAALAVVVSGVWFMLDGHDVGFMLIVVGLAVAVLVVTTD